MNDETKIYTASSQQWRLVDPNRPPGMPPLTSAELVDKETPKTNIKPVDGAYYYKSFGNQSIDRSSVKASPGSSYHNNRNTNQDSGNASKFSVQQRLLKFK